MKDFHVRRGAHWMVMSLLLTVAGCGADSPTDGGDDVTTEVTIRDFLFDPVSIQVSPGAMVMWTWAGNEPHNVTFADSAIANSVTQITGTFQTALPTATGVYTYQCTIHPTLMNAFVTVQ